MTSMTPSVDDVITAEVIRGALLVAAEEASIIVVRAAHSTFIQEGADACAAILDADAQLVALSTATSVMHAASLSSSGGLGSSCLARAPWTSRRRRR
jgi:N-methylhydantoinase B